MQLAMSGACKMVSLNDMLDKKNFSEHLVHSFSASDSSSMHKKYNSMAAALAMMMSELRCEVH